MELNAVFGSRKKKSARRAALIDDLIPVAENRQLNGELLDVLRLKEAHLLYCAFSRHAAEIIDDPKKEKEFTRLCNETRKAAASLDALVEKFKAGELPKDTP